MPDIQFCEPKLDDLPDEPLELGCLPLERTVLLPGTIVRYHSVDPTHWRLLLDAARAHKLIVACPRAEDGTTLHEVGVIARYCRCH